MTPTERLDNLSVKMQRMLRAAQEDYSVTYSLTVEIKVLVSRFIMHKSRELDIFVDLLELLTVYRVSSSQFANQIQDMRNEWFPRMKKKEPKLKIL